jgi:hypothetical protein
LSTHDQICPTFALLEIEDKNMSRIKSLLFLLVLAAQVPLASATVTYVVGSCKPSLPSFTTINGALGATPPPNVVEVCPGTYPEQVVITFPVTLEGISAGNFTRAVITVPPGGLAVNTISDTNFYMAVQVWADNASGEVNLINLTIDGTGNNITISSTYYAFVAGVFYHNSPGTMNHFTIRNQSSEGNGVGVWLEGGSNNPSVTVENSNIQGFDNSGITETNSTLSEPELTAIIRGNYLTGPGPENGSIGVWGLYLTGASISASGNLVTEVPYGIVTADPFASSVSKNTVVSANFGIDISGGASVTSNAIYNTDVGMGGFVGSAQVTGNAIIQSSNAIDFACVTGPNVHSNTILGAANGLTNVPTGATSSNTYYNVGTIRSGGC